MAIIQLAQAGDGGTGKGESRLAMLRLILDQPSTTFAPPSKSGAVISLTTALGPSPYRARLRHLSYSSTSTKLLVSMEYSL